ncbi:hypothetical protein CPT76_26120, partial [Paenibacillus sp. AR247]
MNRNTSLPPSGTPVSAGSALRSRIRFGLVTLVVIAVYWWSIQGMHFEGIQGTAGTVSKSILTGFLH